MINKFESSRKIYDCFLFNNEVELLDIRLELLSSIVDYFVIIQSTKTFTNIESKIYFPYEDSKILKFGDRIRIITLDYLEGSNAWARESFSRNSISRGLYDALEDDIIMVSDIDELPRPDILFELKNNGINKTISLYLDYFNFKFNYKLFHGLDAQWAGPVLQPYSKFINAQTSRDLRWYDGNEDGRIILNAGWHFSFLTDSNDVKVKLKSYSHQDKNIQCRKNHIDELIDAREGFYDHVLPGSVWGVISTDEYGCSILTKLIKKYPNFILFIEKDDLNIINNKIALSMRKIVINEKYKLIKFFKWSELALEVLYRIRKKLNMDHIK